MKSILLATLLITCILPIHAMASHPFLVREGVPQAEIIIAEKSPRTTLLAAQELQTYLRKISGAKLSIVTKPTGKVPVRVFIGRSSHTDKLKITTKELKYGAYRIVSGDNWLVLIGDDTDFTPIEPWPRNYGDIKRGKMQQAWDQITDHHWGYPHSGLRRHYSGPNSLFGTPNEQKVDKDGNVNVWTFDERGSFNAVCGFLRDLGVRWYMPGVLGEIVPKKETIALPKIDKTVHPDFPMRIFNFRPGVYGREVMMWGFRLGVRQPYGRQAAHGLRTMTHNEYTLKNHPDWFALYGGKRHNQPGQRLNQLCYSNEELFKQTVCYVQAQFDHFDMAVVSVMPPDGYTAMCQCELCKGKDSPELGERGRLSNYVWSFVNRVAKEVGKTHPGKKISNCAYGIYTLPPSNIEKLEPNVQVIIVGGRRPTNPDRDELRKLREAWAKKTDNPIEIFENYPFTGRGFYLPAYIPRVMGESINETKEISRGEDIWLTMDFGEDAVGYNHFLIYFTARMYWGGKNKDVVKMFDEYCNLFYGPAAGEMRTFFRYCEDNWREMEKDAAKANRALELFAVAKAKAKADSVYGKRIQLIDNYLNGLRNKSKQLAQKRGPVPYLRLVGEQRGEIVIDGKLDDEPWQKCPVSSTGKMRELQTVGQPIYGTSIKTAWIGNNLYFAVRCEDHPGDALNIATKTNGDQAIWYGDVVEILLATESHSYYQIAVNPAGALIDLDRGADRKSWFSWSSQAEVATQIANDHWTVEIRIPVTKDDNDPLHQIVGRKPTQSLPWHINICRQRIRENSSEYSAFSPTAAKHFHEVMKFGQFYHGRSHKFPADSSVSDFILASRKAAELQRGRKYKEALAAFVTLATGKKATNFQKSFALQQAASCARSLKDFQRAGELAKQIPLDAVAKTVQMENLLAQRKFDVVIDQFGEEDLHTWPFWQIGAGAFARAKAYAFKKAGAKAEADFKTALTYTADTRLRISIFTLMGNNRERNLNDEEGALKAYRKNYESTGRIGAADQFRSVLNAAGILKRQGKFDEALAVLNRTDVKNLKGYWRHSILLALGGTLAAAGRKAEALQTYNHLLSDDSILTSQREAALKALKKLKGEQN